VISGSNDSPAKNTHGTQKVAAQLLEPCQDLSELCFYLGQTAVIDHIKWVQDEHADCLVIKPDKGVDRASTDISDFEITRLSAVTHQMCLVLWTWRKLADETNVKNAPKIC